MSSVECRETASMPGWCSQHWAWFHPRRAPDLRPRGWRPDVAWKWSKWTFGFWWDRDNKTLFGVDVGPLEVVWRYEGYRP